MADANIYIAGASISPTSVQTGAKYAIAVDVRNVQYVWLSTCYFRWLDAESERIEVIIWQNH